MSNSVDILWVGLSDKPLQTYPLSPTTNSGALISQIESHLPNTTALRTNLVKFAPLDSAGMLRYPNKKEIEASMPAFVKEIETANPRVVFLLGRQVAEAVSKAFGFELRKSFWGKPVESGGRFFVPIQHPSYIQSYRRRMYWEYVSQVAKIAKTLLEKEQSV